MALPNCTSTTTDFRSWISPNPHENLPQASQPIAGGSGAPKFDQRLLNHECIICTDLFHQHQTITLQCGHCYCQSCLKTYFINATRDESLYPPKCCSSIIDYALVQDFMTAAEATRYQEARIEYGTKHRVYCSNTRCGTFIPPVNFEDNHATCICGSQTCIHCKQEFHTGDCPEDTDLQAAKTLMAQEGWRRCANCSNGVEKTEGCIHMTCLCGYEFCYACGLRWRTCACPPGVDYRRIDIAAALVPESEDQRLARHIRTFGSLEAHDQARRDYHATRLQYRRLRTIVSDRVGYPNQGPDARTAQTAQQTRASGTQTLGLQARMDDLRTRLGIIEPPAAVRLQAATGTAHQAGGQQDLAEPQYRRDNEPVCRQTQTWAPPSRSDARIRLPTRERRTVDARIAAWQARLQVMAARIEADRQQDEARQQERRRIAREHLRDRIGLEIEQWRADAARRSTGSRDV